jgi:hypothetical protein
MTSTPLDKLAPMATPLPAAPTDALYTDEQWATLMSIMDTVIPSIRRESTTTNQISQLNISDVEYGSTIDHIQKSVASTPSSESLDKYFDERPSDYPEFKDAMNRMLSFYVREDRRKGLGFILSALK